MLTFDQFILMRDDYNRQATEKLEVLVEHRCGHDYPITVSLVTGSRVEKAAQQPCPDCEMGIEVGFQRQAHVARVRAEELELPDLTGVTARQVNFGLVCRDSAIRAHGPGPIWDVLTEMTDAVWWIDNRTRLRHDRVFTELRDGKRRGHV